MDIATNYDKIFDKRMIVITGVARSGTTIIGKIIGSFSDVKFLFEPTTFVLLPPLIQNNHLSKKEGGHLLKAILFEDLYLQMMQGRYVNFNKSDNSYIGNYVSIKDIEQRWEKFKRKKDVLNSLEKNTNLFVIKIPNIQPFYSLLKELFPGIKFIDIIRDGNDIVSSSIRREFYSEDDLNRRIVNWSYRVDNLLVPWFIDEEYKESFVKWNYPTRVAYIWRILTEQSLDFANKNKSDVLQFKHEEFVKDPELFVGKMEKFVGKNKTDITKKHIDSVRSYKDRKYPDNTSDIESPEREKFIELRKKLGY